MDIKSQLIERGFSYLFKRREMRDSSCGPRMVIAGLAMVVTPREAVRMQGNDFIELHKIQLEKGRFRPASASLHLAAGSRKWNGEQRDTFGRKQEFVRGVVAVRDLVARNQEKEA